MPPRPAAISALSTPALVVDLDVFEANVSRMVALLRGTGKTVRPHVKTHRTPELARRQLGETAVGITCATVGEAEVMVDAGIDDVLVANEVVTPAKVARLIALAHRAKITVAADAAQPVDALSRQAVRSGVTVGLLIDIDILAHRCGVSSVGAVVALARLIVRKPGIRLAGLMGYEGRVRADVPDRAQKIAQAYAVLADAREALLQAGFPVDSVSAAGTSTLPEALADPTITEVQAGVYALMEPQLAQMGLPFRCAVTVRSSVISRHLDRVVLDAGRRTVGVEYGPPIPLGLHPAHIAVSDEHTVLTVSGDIPKLGSQIELVPGQIRTTFNLHDRVWVRRGTQIIDCWEIAARGRSQ